MFEFTRHDISEKSLQEQANLCAKQNNSLFSKLIAALHNFKAIKVSL